MTTIPEAAPAPVRPAKVVFLDIDGTLVPEKSHVVPERTRLAVAGVMARGIRVVLATGRPVHNVLLIGRQLRMGEGCYVIASNGAITGHFTGRRRRPLEIVRTCEFDPRAAFGVAMGAHPDVRMAVELVGKGWHVNVPFGPGQLSGVQRVVPEKRLWAEGPVTRAVVRADGIADIVPDIERAGYTAYSAGPNHVDITARGLSKAAATDWLRDMWGIHPDDTAAAGDGASDVPLLRQARWSCAMGHAPREVRDVADDVVGSIAEEGIVPWLGSLVLSDGVPRRRGLETMAGTCV